MKVKNPAQEVIEAVQILIDNAIKKTTNVNGGIITSIGENGKYFVVLFPFLRGI